MTRRGKKVSRPRQTGKAISPQRRFFLAYAGVLAIAGMGAAYLATSAMGPGISTDSAMILSTAENLTKGRGLVDYAGRELTQFPPLYSLILAGARAITTADVFVIGWALNILVFGALIFFTGLYLFDAFEQQPIIAYLGAFVVLASTSVLQISSNIASDPLFMLMVIFWLMCATAYLKTRRATYAVLAGALTIIACFQRYAGLALVITGALVAAYAFRRDWRGALLAAGVFGAVTAAPIFAWGYLHNAPTNATVFGARLPSLAWGNFVAGAEKMLYWFIPYRVISAVGAPVLLLLVVAATAGIIYATGAKKYLEDLQQPHIAPNVVFLVVYLSVLVFDISYYELKGLLTDRVHIVALPPLLMVLGAIASRALTTLQGRFGGRAVYAGAILLFVLWAPYPLSKSADYVTKSMRSGDVSPYNSINKGHVRDSELAGFLRGLPVQGKKIYSNGGDTVWFILRRQVSPLPILGTTDREGELSTLYPNWPGKNGGGYIVWLTAEASKTYYATADELGGIANVKSLYADTRGSVYSVRPR